MVVFTEGTRRVETAHGTVILHVPNVWTVDRFKQAVEPAVRRMSAKEKGGAA